MSGLTALKAHIVLKCPVDAEVQRGLELLTSQGPEILEDDEPDLPNHSFWQASAYYMLRGRLTFDGCDVVVDADLKNKDRELERFLVWLAPFTEALLEGTWLDYDMEDEPLELRFVIETGKFYLRGTSGDREITAELPQWQVTQ